MDSLAHAYVPTYACVYVCRMRAARFACMCMAVYVYVEYERVSLRVRLCMSLCVIFRVYLLPVI